MIKNSTFVKLFGWPILAAVPFIYGIDQAYAKVGIASVVNGEPRSQQPNAAERILHIGNDMIAEEIIKTGANDRAHIVFLDGSTLTVGTNSQITIDKFVYDTSKKTGVLSFNASRGMFRYVGGAISKTSEVTVKSPSATMGIRGGIGVFSIDTNGDSTAALLFGKSLVVTAQGVSKITYKSGTQISVKNGSSPDDPMPIPPNFIQQIDQQFQASASGNNGVLSLPHFISGSSLPDHNSKMSPATVRNQIEETREIQDKVHSTETQEAFNIYQGAGPLEGTRPLRGNDVNDGQNPQQGFGPLQNAGPLTAAGPLQGASPLQNAGPLAASTPFQQAGPILTQMALSLTGAFPGMNIPTVLVTDVNFIPYIPGIISKNPISITQLQSIVDDPQGKNTNTSGDPPYTPPPTYTPLPPVIYTPPRTGYVSPN